MNASLPPYPAKKDSGVSWLGSVPEHWRVLPNRAIFEEVKDRNRPDAAMLSVTIERGVIRQETLLEDSSKKDSSKLDRSAYKFVQVGDIAYNKMRAWQGAIGVSDYEGIVSPAYVVQRPRNCSLPRFLHYLLRTPAFAKEAERWSYGITSDMWSLRPEHFKNIYSCVPPLPEQAVIVRFLDDMDRRIRRYIRAKQKLIKLLEEQKQAIIHRAVTRGLDPGVRLKPSGVEWMGEVPEHWNVARASTVCRLLSAKAHEQFVEPDGEHICVTARFVSTEGREFRRCTQNLSPAQRDDVLMVMSDLPRGRALARTYLVEDSGSYAVNQRVCILRSFGIVPWFLSFVANRHPELMLHDDGFNQTHLPNSAFKTMRLPVPPREEQQMIAAFLRKKVEAVATLVSGADREITLLSELRTRLIADVVTGKLDVREAAARLPDEPCEDDLADDVDDAAADLDSTESDADEDSLAEVDA